MCVIPLHSGSKYVYKVALVQILFGSRIPVKSGMTHKGAFCAAGTISKRNMLWNEKNPAREHETLFPDAL